MKRNFIITLLLTFMMLFVTACGSDNNNKTIMLTANLKVHGLLIIKLMTKMIFKN